MNSQGTIQGHICPITIRFPAYRKKSTFQTVRTTAIIYTVSVQFHTRECQLIHHSFSKILLQRDMKSLIAGTEQLVPSTTFHDAVYTSFLETLIQGLSDFTSDINEYLRLGRGLWPLYVSPLLLENIENTIAFVQQANVAKGEKSTNGNKEDMERDLLPLLDQKFFPHLRHALEYGFGVLCFDSSGTVTTTTHRNNSTAHDDDLPILVKYLLLAAYICHRNRQDKDRHLFSIERNGRKRRKTKEADNEEEMAYGTSTAGSQQDAPKTIRPRTFPMERLYSLYVSIVSLNASRHHRSGGTDSIDMDNNEMLRSLGNIRFLETITYLRDIGVLHDFPKRSPNEPIRFSQRNLWTTITQDEAQDIARSVNFPLDRYIL
jgi:Origin recognition complex (ORC) subunit 5 C-terminus